MIGTCRLCNEEFTGRGHPPGATIHFNCQIVAKHALDSLGVCLKEAGMLAQAFKNGYEYAQFLQSELC